MRDRRGSDWGPGSCISEDAAWTEDRRDREIKADRQRDRERNGRQKRTWPLAETCLGYGQMSILS